MAKNADGLFLLTVRRGGKQVGVLGNLIELAPYFKSVLGPGFSVGITDREKYVTASVSEIASLTDKLMELSKSL